MDTNNGAHAMTTAQTIAAQIGNRAFAMLGARNLVSDRNSLTFKVGTNPRKVTHLSVRLDASDTYTVEAIKMRGVNFNRVGALSEVYVDGLHSAIESLTGLYTRL